MLILCYIQTTNTQFFKNIAQFFLENIMTDNFSSYSLSDVIYDSKQILFEYYPNKVLKEWKKGKPTDPGSYNEDIAYNALKKIYNAIKGRLDSNAFLKNKIVTKNGQTFRYSFNLLEKISLSELLVFTYLNPIYNNSDKIYIINKGTASDYFTRDVSTRIWSKFHDDKDMLAYLFVLNSKEEYSNEEFALLKKMSRFINEIALFRNMPIFNDLVNNLVETTKMYFLYNACSIKGKRFIYPYRKIVENCSNYPNFKGIFTNKARRSRSISFNLLQKSVDRINDRLGIFCEIHALVMKTLNGQQQKVNNTSAMVYYGKTSRITRNTQMKLNKVVKDYYVKHMPSSQGKLMSYVKQAPEPFLDTSVVFRKTDGTYKVDLELAIASFIINVF